jgi:hypothetical protein
MRSDRTTSPRYSTCSGHAALAFLSLALTGCGDGLFAPSTDRPPPARVVVNLATPLDAASQSETIRDQYIVVFRNDVSDVHGLARQLIAEAAGRELFTYTHAVRGFAAQLSSAKAEALRLNPHVESVTPDVYVQTTTVQPDATWGIDRVDQRTLPLGNEYLYDRTGAGVTAYIIDTGIRYTHSEFEGRASLGTDITGGDGSDCLGHGTHVAGTVGGKTYGVAKQVALRSVRVFGCSNTTSESMVIAGIDWVTGHAKLPAVVNMSLGGPLNGPLNDAVAKSVAAGIVYVVAAGNSNSDACQTSPASVGAALTIGATDPNDSRASFSNWGACIDVFAPGVSITSASGSDDRATATMSGTSMASPHAAGVAALYLQGHPRARPAEVGDSLQAYATKGVVQNANSANWHLIFSKEVRDDRDVGPPSVALPPISPSNLQGVVQEFWDNGSYVLLSWTDNSADEEGFNIEGSSDATSISGTTRADLTSLRVKLAAGMWQIRIRSFNASGTGVSEWANTIICVPRQAGDCSTVPPADTVTPPPPAEGGSPTASFSVKCPSNKSKCTFDASQSTAASGVASFTWNFGDGSTQSSSANPIVDHAYKAKGTYTASLTVTDTKGLSATTAQDIVIKSVSR